MVFYINHDSLNGIALFFYKKHLIYLFALVLIFLSLFGCSFTPRALNKAAWDNDINLVKTLIKDGESINKQGTSPTGHFSATALDDAIEKESIEVVHFLMESGADMNFSHRIFSPRTLGFFHGSSFILACAKGNMQIVELLIEAGADINQLVEKDHMGAGLNEWVGFDSLYFATIFSHLEISALLIKHGADINRTYADGKKIAYEVVAKGQLEIVPFLVEKGLKIEPNENYMHYVAELYHIAADYYVPIDEKKALRFYKQAISFYPMGIKNWENLVSHEDLKNFGMALLAAGGTALNAYGSKSQAIQNRNLYTSLGISSGGPIYYSYTAYDFKPNLDKKTLYMLEAKKCKINYNICKTILNCYEGKKSNATLADCINEITPNNLDG